MSYNSKYTGEQVEEMLDQIASGEIGGGEGTYIWDVSSSQNSGTITPEEYTAIKESSKVVVRLDNTTLVDVLRSDDSSQIALVHTYSAVQEDGETTFLVTMAFVINSDYTYEQIYDYKVIPTKISELENDSKYLTNEQYNGTIKGITIAASNGLAGGGTVSADTGSTDGTITIRGVAATNKGKLGMSVLYSGDLKDKTYQDGAAAAAAHTHSQYLTGVTINGTTKNPTSGVVDLGTVITSHQDISGKQDKLVSGTNIKTINGASILGSGNITIEGGGGTSQFYITDFTISDLQQLVNGDLTEVSANCSALSQALQNNQIIVIPYGLTEDGYFGYSLPDVYYEDLLYMTITDSGSGIVYAVEVDTYSNYISSGHVSIVNNNNGAIVQGGSAIDLKIDFNTLYEHYDRNRELDTIELNYEGCTDSLFRELTWEEVDSLIIEGNYSFFTTNDFVDEYSDRISCPVVVGYESQSGFKSLYIYSQVMRIPMYEYNYLITFRDGNYCTITRYRNGGYTQNNKGTDTSSYILPNEFYVWDEVTDLTIMLDPAWADSTPYTKEYLFQFTSGSEPTTLSLPESIKWSNGEVPVIEANKIYQISILKGLGSVLSWDNAEELIDNKLEVVKSGKSYIIQSQYPVESSLYIILSNAPISSITFPAGSSSYSLGISPTTPSISMIDPSKDNIYKYIW